MSMPLINAICVPEIIWYAIGENLIAYPLEINLNITLIRAIGQNCLLLSIRKTFGISDRTPKFSWEMSTIPKAKVFKICKTTGLRKRQKDLKKKQLESHLSPERCQF
jgi:hypothetical protein